MTNGNKTGMMIAAFILVLSVLISPSLNVARGAEKVVVYSPHGEDMLSDVAERFEKETGIRMEFLDMAGGQVVDRVRAEKNNPQADIIYGNPSSVFIELKQDGILAPYQASWADDLAAAFKDADGYWYGTIQTPVVLFYNHQMLTDANAPHDWFDLADPQYKDQLVFRSTTSAASRATHAALFYLFDQRGALDTEGWDFFRKLDANVKKYVYNSSLMFQSVGRKEASVGFWVLSGVIDQIKKNKMPLTIVQTQSGSPVITDGIALVKGGPNGANAQKFLEFAGRPDTQAHLANQFNRMPTHPKALDSSPEWMKDFTYKIMDVDWGRLSEKQSEWIQYYEDNVRDSAKVQDK